MRFKDFIKLTEDNGLLGFNKASSLKKPSDGQPFKNLLGPVSGQEPRGNTGSPMGAPGSNFGMNKPAMFMKKMKRV